MVQTKLQITPLVQRQTENEEEEELLQPKANQAHPPEITPQIASHIHGLKGGGQSLSASQRTFFEPRFGTDFSNVRLYTDSHAGEVAKGINARAFTVGKNVVFGAGEYSPESNDGKRLLAHELTHVVQQRKFNHGLNQLIQRQDLEFRPSTQGTPCACLVFVHNNEWNARRAVENLHRVCRYNLAIIGPSHGGRRITATGVTRSSTESRNGRLFVDGIEVRCRDDEVCTVDPNEMFSQSIQDRCTADEDECRTYISTHTDFTAQRMRFFLAIKDCSDNFSLPTVALHNNAIDDTERFRGAIPAMGHRITLVMENIDRETEGGGRGSREDLENRLESLSESSGGSFRRLLTRTGTTNIFRWCNLPEIGRCHIGDPFRPDHVIWVTNIRDFDRLQRDNVNVVLQEGLDTTGNSESKTDLSTLFLRLGADAHYLNIETPITPEDDETRLSNMIYILQNLTRVGLNCCDLPESE